jgi:hypothetical protein
MEIPGSRRTYALGFQIFRVALLVGIASTWWYCFLIANR